jgi:hypothetical protein
MAERKWDFANCVRPILVVCLICVFITVIIVRCDPEDGDDGCQLVLERGDVGVWMATSNEVATSSASTYDRQGFLVQLGDFELSLHEYDGFSIAHTGGVEKYARGGPGTAYWIDINAGTSDAIDPAHAVGMFPYAISETCQGDFDDADVPACVRTRTIHPYMETGHALITFWQGDSGWEVETEVSAGISNGFCFELEDPFTVKLWTGDMTVDAPEFTLVAEWAAGEVSSITVHAKSRGVDRGEMQAPPWIYP